MKYSYRFLIFLSAIVALAFYLRFYKVADTPHDLYVDEVAIGYNAYSILKTGRDEFGVFLPLWFKSFGDYKLPVYIYATAISELIFGRNAFAVRFPSVFFGGLTVLVFTQLLLKLTKSARFSLLAGLLLAISPWHLHFSRAGFETNLSLFWTVLGTYLIVRACNQEYKNQFPKVLDRRLSKISPANFKRLFAGLICFTLSLYTYHNSRLFIPLFLILIVLSNQIDLKAFLNKTAFKLSLLILILILIPYLYYAISPFGLARAKNQSFLNDLPPQISQNITKTINWATNQFGKNYLSYFSLDFLFFTGDSIGRHSVREIGLFYLWQLPFFLIGLIGAIKKSADTDKIFLCWLAAAPLSASSASPNPHALRALLLVIPLTYFITLGVMQIQKHRFLFRFIAAFTIGYFLFSYLHIYYSHYPSRTSADWSGGYKEAITYALANEDKYQQITFTDVLKKGYIYLYFYKPFDPKFIQQSSHPEQRIGKFAFIGSPYEMPNVKTLYFSLPSDVWQGKLIGNIRNRTGDSVFYIWEN